MKSKHISTCEHLSVSTPTIRMGVSMMKRLQFYGCLVLFGFALTGISGAPLSAATNVLTDNGAFGAVPHTWSWQSAVTTTSGSTAFRSMIHHGKKGTNVTADWTVVVSGPFWGPSTTTVGYHITYQQTGTWDNWSTATGTTGVLPPYTDWNQDSNHLNHTD